MNPNQIAPAVTTQVFEQGRQSNISTNPTPALYGADKVPSNERAAAMRPIPDAALNLPSRITRQSERVR